MLARHLTSFEIEGIAVAVVRRRPEHRHAPIVIEVAQLAVVGNVAPDEIATLAGPGGPFRPGRAGPEALDGGIVQTKPTKRRINRDDIRIGIRDRRSAGAEIAR